MKRRTEDRLFVAVIALSIATWAVMVVVFILLLRAMLHAAQRGDTAMTIFYGVLILVLALSGGSRSKS